MAMASSVSHRLFTDQPKSGKLVLDFPNYVDTVCDLILNSEPVLSIGIFGSWGTGKTTLLTNMRDKLMQNGCTCAFFDAWKYEHETAQIKIPLVLTIISALYEANRENINLLSKG